MAGAEPLAAISFESCPFKPKGDELCVLVQCIALKYNCDECPLKQQTFNNASIKCSSLPTGSVGAERFGCCCYLPVSADALNAFLLR